MTTPRSTALHNPEDHARWLHPVNDTTTAGLVTIARQEQGHWVEQRVSVHDLPAVVRDLGGIRDTYISQNRFMGPRKITHLWQLDSMWADLDYQNTQDWQHRDPRAVLDVVQDTLMDARVPEPSFSVATGRGLALVWLHTPVPRAAVARWNACQKTLYTILRPYGADRLALDAARVLRLVGTRHSRSGRLVEALTPVGRVWPFDSWLMKFYRFHAARSRIYGCNALSDAHKGPKAATNRHDRTLHPCSRWEPSGKGV